MHILKISDIAISPNRQRKEFDAESLLALATSIQSKGLMHPIVVRKVGEGVQLVAGERRLRAIGSFDLTGGAFKCNGQDIEPGTIPVTFLGELSDLDAEEAELEENIARVDLTWQERSAAHARLHDLRTKQAVAKNLAPQTFKTTTEEIIGRKLGPPDGGIQHRIRRDIILAHHLDNPSIAKAKDPAEAYKILKKIELQKRNADIAAVVGKTFGAADHSLQHGDSLVLLKGFPAETFDIILTDPPYGMGADEFGDAGGTLVEHTHNYKDDEEHFVALMDEFIPESFRVAKPQAHMYLFCDIDKFHQLRNFAAVCGWKVHRTPLIWAKPHAQRVPWPDQGPRRQYEIILYAVKGNKTVSYIGSDVIEAKQDENLGHPAQKPVLLLQELLKRSGLPGSKVLDPFAGTGSTIVAAHELQMPCVGMELADTSYGIAVQRLQALK